MRIVKKGDSFEIFVREEQPYFEDYALSCKLGLSPLYSKNRELVKFRVWRGSEDYEEIIPEIMPFRKYVLTFGKEYTTPKICIDDFNEISLWSYFEFPQLMIVEKMDESGFDYYERRNIREIFLREWFEEHWFIDFERKLIESYYFNRKLYFFFSDESYYIESFEEFLKTFSEYLELLKGKTPEIRKSEEDHAFVSCEREEYLLLYREYDENMTREDKFSKERITNLLGKCKKPINIILEDYEVNDALEKDAIDWILERKFNLKTFDEFMVEYMLRDWDENDEIASSDPEWVKEIIESIFY